MRFSALLVSAALLTPLSCWHLASRAPIGQPARARTLVLYDDGGSYAWLGGLYATGAGVLASHFGGWSAMPVSAYQRGTMQRFDAAIYVGSTFDQPLPAAFTDDVLGETTDVIWMGDNIWQLARSTPDFATRFGFAPGSFDRSPVHAVSYKGVRLARQADATSGILTYDALDTGKATVLAEAVRDDGSTLPWAVRARRLTYVGENPLAFVTPGDRYLALCDLLFDSLAPRAKERHRALVRIEDVNPRSSPDALRKIADRLAERNIPFSVALIPVYQDRRQRLRLRDAPAVVAALKYMLERGGSLVLHGYTHQYRTLANPYDGTTGADFEFYRAHLDGNANVILDGPVAEDSEEWASDRVTRALGEVSRAGLPRPRAFEYPHYAGSPADSRAIARQIGVAFQREVFFPDGDTTHPLGLSFPFVVDDVYGFRVVPENVGYYIPETESQEMLMERARALRVVRDGVAGFFFHPIYDADLLARIVDGITAAGYSFATIDELTKEAPSGG
jgi:uncharacterized protein YdaL